MFCTDKLECEAREGRRGCEANERPEAVFSNHESRSYACPLHLSSGLLLDRASITGSDARASASDILHQFR
jgi:hypothetical protein